MENPGHFWVEINTEGQELSGNYWTSQLSKGHFELKRKPSEEQIVTEKIDVLLVTAIPLEYDAALVAFSELSPGHGVRSWDERNDVRAPYVFGTYSRGGVELFRIAVAKPGRMGSIETGRLAATLIERLSPQCLVMCGVCAGNPGDVALGDLVISELAYQYDEGKRESGGFVADHRQSPVSTAWKRAADELRAEDLPSYGRPSDRDARYWLLERLSVGDRPKDHPARERYFKRDEWKATIEALEQEELVKIVNGELKLTENGICYMQRSVLLDTDPPDKLPIAIKVGPIASGNVVVKDGVTWELLKKLGVRSVAGLEMEAATIGSVARASGVPEWLVIKGVMDHADPRKDDRYKPFAARASAEALRLFLDRNFLPATRAGQHVPDNFGFPPLTLGEHWTPRIVSGAFFDKMMAAVTERAPNYLGLIKLALKEAKLAYSHADSAYEVADSIRKVLGRRILEAQASEFEEPLKILHAGMSPNGRQLIAQIYDSHDEYLGEAVDGTSDGLGVGKVFQISMQTTPSLKASVAGQWESDTYGPYAVYTFPDNSQFAGAWSSGNPTLGYREFLGGNEILNCDFYVGALGLKSASTRFQRHWVPHGKGIAVDAASRRARLGILYEGAFERIEVEVEF